MAVEPHVLGDLLPEHDIFAKFELLKSRCSYGLECQENHGHVLTAHPLIAGRPVPLSCLGNCVEVDMQRQTLWV